MVVLGGWAPLILQQGLAGSFNRPSSSFPPGFRLGAGGIGGLNVEGVQVLRVLGALRGFVAQEVAVRLAGPGGVLPGLERPRSEHEPEKVRRLYPPDRIRLS